MTKVHTILHNYLHQAGALEPIKLGEPGQAINVTDKDRQALFNRLLVQTKFNNRIVIVVTILHFALFILAIWLVYYYRESFNAVVSILGGSVLSLLAITRSLTGLWREKWMLDILVSTLPNLTPEQSLEFIKSFYYSQMPSRPPST
jgi:hypothetical protein